jgi:prepilin-type N-terminal cleavage/methylation domain-containing protein
MMPRSTRLAHRPVGRRGLSLVELLIAMVVVSGLLGSVVLALRSQSGAFRRGSARAEMLTNGRYAMQQVDRLLRTAGAGTSSSQPTIVYADSNLVAFNADYWTTTTDTSLIRCAVYRDPDAPAGSLDALTSSTAITIPGTSYTYPKATYLPASANCSAETIMLYFRPDSTTAEANDWVLLQRINRQEPVVIARNLFRQATRPFFEYFVHPRTPSTGIDSLVIAGVAGSGITLPMLDSVTIQGGAADTGRATWADSIKAVRVNVRAATTSGTAVATRDISFVTPLQNNGLVQLRTCGDAPLFTGTLAAAVQTTPTLQVTLSWPISADESGGETDVLQYNVYRRRTTDAAWGPAKYTVPVSGTATYGFVDGDLVPGTSYVYRVSAQDCSPSESAFLTSSQVDIP